MINTSNRTYGVTRTLYLTLVQTSIMWYLLLFAYIWHVPAVTTHIR